MHPIVFGIKRAFLTSTTHLRRELRRRFKLTQARFDVLYLVHQGVRAQLQIRQRLRLTSSTVSEMLQTLERLLLVTRTTSLTDGRARDVQLTPEGRRRTDACIEHWISRRKGLRMVREIFKWKADPDTAFHQMDDYEGYLLGTEAWFTPRVFQSGLYPGFHPDD